MSSSFGQRIRVSIFGQSHGEAVGVVIDGLPAGEAVDLAFLERFLARRAPGQADYASPRQEADQPRFLSGLVDGYTCGAPLCALIDNQDGRPEDYAAFADRPRPGHADYPASVKHQGFADLRGGGHFSGRLTAPLCLAGGVLLPLLARRGVSIGGHIAAIGTAADRRFDPLGLTRQELADLAGQSFPVLDQQSGQRMRQQIAAAAADGDSLGGVIEVMVLGLPVGLGEPLFQGLENQISQAVFAVPGVRGIEFGAGFDAARWRGSQHNDGFAYVDGQLRTLTNNHGGVLGGLASGMPLIFRVAFKPTPSIAQEQRSVDLGQHSPVTLRVSGRHDPCFVPRALPAVEAAAAIALADLLL